YFDDTLPEGIVAPPMFAIAVKWPAVDREVAPEAARDIRPNAFATGVHATEHLIVHRLIRPGDRLKFVSRLESMRPTSAGVHRVVKLEAMDADNKPVFTEYDGTMLRGVTCSDHGRAVEPLPEPPFFEKFEEPASLLWDAELPIARQAAHVYDGCSDIVVPIHTSVAFARNVGLPDIILQGTCTLAMAVRELVAREADGVPEKLKEVACRFSRMVIPGTSIKVQLIARESRPDGTHLGFQVLNAAGEKALTRGFARIS
ncbi:MAG: MaoC family dehydratase N-terminal domain-containing protein, partial [Deltaproteobacteria bacterium]|nr:MaoC family dehydratase N-terminal domain-containing protein [Deltaproteobacteria bacterium]